MLLKSAEVDHRREAMRRLGLWVELGREDKNRYADVVFVASGFSPIKHALRIARWSALEIIHPV